MGGCTDALKTKEYAGMLADTINHSTGYVNASFPEARKQRVLRPET